MMYSKLKKKIAQAKQLEVYKTCVYLTLCMCYRVWLNRGKGRDQLVVVTMGNRKGVSLATVHITDTIISL